MAHLTRTAPREGFHLADVPAKAVGLGVVALTYLILAGLYSAVHPIAPFIAFGLFVVLWLIVRDPYVGVVLIFASIALGTVGNLTEDGSITIGKLLVAVVVLLWVVKILVNREITALAQGLRNPTTLALLVFSLIATASIMASQEPGSSIIAVVRLGTFCSLYLLAVCLIRTERQLRTVIAAVLVLGYLLSLGGLYEVVTQRSVQRFFGKQQYLSVGAEEGGMVSNRQKGLIAPTERMGAWVRIQTTFNDPNYYAAYALSILALTLPVILGTRSWKRRIVLCSFAVILVYNILSTGSRSGTATVGLLVALYFVVLPIRNKWVWALGLALVVGVAAVVLPSMMQQFREGFSWQAVKEDPRYGLWIMALHMIADHPFLGVGLGQSIVQYPHYRLPCAQVFPLLPHNTLLQIWAEMGIFGALSAIAVVVMVVVQIAWVMAHTRDRTRWHLSLGLLGAFLAYTTVSFTLGLLEEQNFWCSMGLTVAGAEVLRRAEQQGSWSGGPI